SYGLYNDDRTIVRFHALIWPISGGNIYVHLVIMAFISFLGCFALYKAFKIMLPNLNKYLLIFICFLIPSCWFWTSGILKEGIMMFALGFCVLFYCKLINKFTLKDIVGFVIFACLLAISKVYVLPALIPAFIFLLASKKMKIKFQFILFISIFAVSAVFVVLSDKIIGYNILETISGKQNNFINYLSINNDAGSNFDLTQMNPNVKSFVKLIPEGLINSFFRPFISDINSPAVFFSFLEILLFCLLTFISLLFFRKPNDETMRFILFSTIYILFLYVVIGVYTPNIGALVRYRTPALPFLVAILFCLVNWNKLSSKLGFLKSKISFRNCR
ncbi:hypothetical protein LJC11_01165, partial [Bacteroidales bacterium OttesenSCG-928-I21]|nr:hypothetical protein [Bacteroidales bacterium OttesenSCG-928-I21]